MALAARQAHHHHLHVRGQPAQPAYQPHRAVGGHRGVHHGHLAPVQARQGLFQAGGAAHHF